MELVARPLMMTAGEEDMAESPAVNDIDFGAARTRRTAMVLLFLVAVLNYLDRYMFSVLVPSIKAELGFSDSEIGFINGLAFSIFFAFSGIPIARAADRLSRRKVIAVSLAIWSAATAACGLCRTFVELALARIVIGVGEAGATPTSHAIISDLYPAKDRGLPLAIYVTGSPVGLFIGFAAGAWIADEYGWRAALYAFGIPGIILAGIIWAILPDPPRGYSEPERTTPPAKPLMTELAYLLSRPSFVCVSLGAGFYALGWFGVMLWLPSFFVRTHGMSVTEVGAQLAISIGVAQMIGNYVSGHLSDKLGPGDPRRYFWICAAAMISPLPFYAFALLADSPTPALIALFFPFMLGMMMTGSEFSIVQGVAGPTRRAVATAIILFMINIFGGISVQIVGLVSDALTPTLGDAALGRALLYTPFLFSVLAAVSFAWGTRSVRRDFALAQTL
jgi:predicted MFS family arabinose efflux permease